MEEAKRARLEWLCRLYNGDQAAAAPEAGEANLFEMAHMFGLETFAETFPPLVKLRKQRGEVVFTLGRIEHTAPDLTYADLLVDGEVVFVFYVRFEDEGPYRVKYWSSYPPLPEGVCVRPYTPEDAPGCVALEEACPMELDDGSKWIIDRGEAFDDYLRLMGEVEPWVVEAGNRIVGFYNCALRPASFKGEDGFCVYQHHYRVHPDFRAGSVSMALASHVDPRRTYEHYHLHFPYSLVDPNNVHMQNVGFPAAEGVEIVRLSIPVEAGDAAGDEVDVVSPERVCALINETHKERELFKPYDASNLADRCNRVGSFGVGDYLGNENAVLGVWAVNELNKLHREGRHDEFRLAFVLDYGYTSLAALESVLRSVCYRLASGGTTHLALMCDTRVPEYGLISELAADEQRFRLHTLSWIVPDLQARTVYCDAVYA